MSKKYFILTIFILFCTIGSIQAQSPAALAKLSERFTTAQIADMRLHTHYKYEGLVLYYSSSFLVVDNGLARPATEAEIAALDIDQYKSFRLETGNVTVQDATLGKELQLLGRTEFEQLVLNHLNTADKEAYLAYKAAALSTQGKSNQ